MARLLTCGYETGDVGEQGASAIGSGATLTVVNTTPTPRAGTYCLKFAASAASMGVTTKTFTLTTSKTDLWVRFAVFMHPASSTSDVAFAVFQDAAGTAQNNLTWEISTGLIRLRSGPNPLGTILASGSAPMGADTWHAIDWRMQITSGTAGVSEVWLDGSQIINFSGDNTAVGAQTNVQTLVLGVNGTGLSTATGAYYAFDDLAINDTSGSSNNGRAGDGYVLLLSPTGAGSSTQLTRGGTDTGANWSQVSELPPSSAQYVSSATVGHMDLYALADMGVAVDSINVLEALCLAQNSDTGGGYLAPTVKSGATTNEVTPIPLSTTTAYVTGRWETDPNTSSAWTQAAVNALEAGATIR